MRAYALVRKLATGGMAEVFLARMKGAGGFEKPVAVKRVLPSMAQDPRFIEMFVREARLTVALQHANVVQVLDLGRAGSQYFMVMEFVDGENLRAIQRAAQKANATIGMKEAVYLVQQVCEGLAYAHERTDAQGQPLNIIHRDINPANIMVSWTGEVKLADFGIARAADFNAGTQVGTVKGKSGYIAPELLSGAPPDQRSDLFLVGLLLHELLSGRQLFHTGNYFEDLKLLASFDARKLEPLPGVPLPLWTIIARALSSEPAGRFQRARDLAEALRSYLFEYRLRIGPQDLATLFARVFPDRRSPLEVQSERPEFEIRLDPAPLEVPLPSESAPGSASGDTRTPTPATASGGASNISWNSVVADHPSTGRRRLGEILLQHGKLTPEALHAVLSRQARIGARLGEVLVSEGVIEEDDLVRALAEQQHHPFVTSARLREMPVPAPVVLRCLPVEVAERLSVVPLSISGKQLVCAMVHPGDLARLDAVKFATGMPLRPILAGERGVRMAIRRFYLGEQTHADLGFDLGITPFSDRVTGTRERVFGEEDLTTSQAQAQESETPDDVPPTALPTAAHPTLVVCDDPQTRQHAVRLLLGRGVNAAGSNYPTAAEALGRGHFERVLLSLEGPADPQPAIARLKLAFPLPDYHVVASLAEALVGDSTAVDPVLRLQGRMLEVAISAIGGCGVHVASLKRLTAAVAERLGASRPAAMRAAFAASAFLYVAATQKLEAFARPSPDSVRALLGRDAEALEDVLSGTASAPAQAVAATLALLEVSGSACPEPQRAGGALSRVRESYGLPASTLEALAMALSEVHFDGGGTVRVVLLVEEGQGAPQIHSRLLADGIRALVARSSAEVERFVAEGAAALVASSRPQGIDSLAMIRQLRRAGHALPVFLLTSPSELSLIDEGFEAGADDVLELPVNTDVLSAKLRRATMPRRPPT